MFTKKRIFISESVKISEKNRLPVFNGKYSYFSGGLVNN